MEMQHPGRKPTVITAKVQVRVPEGTRRKPKDGSTHWSVRKMARELNISKDTVHRIWRTAGVKPHRLERYMASDDPDFGAKAADVIGLYLNPPQPPLSSAWMRSRRFGRWTGWIQCFRCPLAESNVAASSIIGTAHFRYMPHWT